jgi:hypothetical protein
MFKDTSNLKHPIKIVTIVKNIKFWEDININVRGFIPINRFE